MTNLDCEVISKKGMREDLFNGWSMAHWDPWITLGYYITHDWTIDTFYLLCFVFALFWEYEEIQS